MPLRTIATFAIAIVLGLIAVVLVNGYLNKNKGQAPLAVASAAPGSPVVVAAQPIARGVVVQPQLLKVVNYPAGAVPTGAFTAISQLTGTKDQQRVALRDLGPDEPVLATRVSAPGGKLNLATVISPGMQAVSLHDNDVAGVGGFILPGDRVDVLLTRSVGPATGQTVGTEVTQLIADNIRVLGIDQADNDETNTPVVGKSITVEVTPDQAQSITLAQTLGNVSFSLRHVTDVLPTTRRATTAAALGFVQAAARTHAKGTAGPPNVPTVRVTRVTDTTVYPLMGR